MGDACSLRRALHFYARALSAASSRGAAAVAAATAVAPSVITLPSTVASAAPATSGGAASAVCPTVPVSAVVVPIVAVQQQQQPQQSAGEESEGEEALEVARKLLGVTGSKVARQGQGSKRDSGKGADSDLPLVMELAGTVAGCKGGVCGRCNNDGAI